MAQEPADIAISKDNIKISYRRYLSDSSAGFMLLILLIAFFYKDISSISATLPSEVVAFVGLILFLLATPVGIAINVMSWFSLEGSQTMTERQIIADKFNIFWSVYREKGTRKLRITRVKPKTLEFFQKEYLFEKVKEHFSLSDETWGSTYEKLKTHLELDAPSLIYAIEPVRGVSIFLRMFFVK